MIRLRRSVLYVPADNARAMTKARDLSHDVAILDLEDAVAPAAKKDARNAATRARGIGPEVALRVNGADTPWHKADLNVVRDGAYENVVLPKARTARDVETLAAATEACVWPMIETAKAVLEAPAIAEAAARTGPAALVLGLNDLVAELGVAPGPDRAELAYALQRTVLSARAAGIDVLDGVFNDVADADGLAREAAAAKAMGMTGKTVIHPAQIGPVNAAFAPDEAAVEEARRIVEAMEAAEREGRAVATVDGRLVEALHAAAARRTLQLAAAVEERTA